MNLLEPTIRTWKESIYIFQSLDRNLSSEECEELAKKYFQTHNKVTLPGQALIVDLRPAFRTALENVMPRFPLFKNVRAD